MPDHQRLETPADLDRIFSRATTEGWTESAPDRPGVGVRRVARDCLLEQHGWQPDLIFALEFELEKVPDTLLAQSTLEKLDLSGNKLGPAGAS